MEIEKKYLMEELPAFVRECPYKELTQGYVLRDPVIRIRSIRKQGDAASSYVLTVKGPGFAMREEFELPMEEKAFLELKEKCTGIFIEKTRYLVPLADGHTAEVDVFGGEHKGLILAEVEFASEEEMNAFTAPEWMGKDVTGMKEYQNSTLSGGERA